MSLSFISPLTTSLPTTPQKKLVFIDAAVDNFSSLLKGLEPNSEAIVLDSNQDGVMQISNFLANYQGAIDSIQILSHGAEGSLQLGSSRLSLDNLAQYENVLSDWFASSSNSSGTKPDLLLYGCDVATGEVGQEFVEKLSKITGADVAASIDPTGSVAKGGNWILEKVTGAIEATSAFTQTVKDAYADILATFTVTNDSDAGAGSLRQAILDANGTAGLDAIIFDPSVKLIKPNSPLPKITDPINIDGRPGQAGTLPGVEINGLNAGTDYNQNSGLQLYGPKTTAPAYAGADGSTIRGLSITGFWGNGLLLFQTDNNTIEYNHIGTDVTGTVAKGNSRANDASIYHALLLRGSQNNNISNNLVSGNYGSGIVLFGSNLGLNFGYADRNGIFPGTNRNSTGNQIINNTTGLDITRERALSNERIGIFIEGMNNLVEGNFVAGNGTDSTDSGTYARGLMAEASPSTEFNTFRNNIVGTNPSRTVAIPNRTSNGDIEDAGGSTKLNYFQGNTYYGDWYGNSPNNPAKNLGGNVKQTGALAPSNPVLTPIAPQLTDITSNQPVNNGDLIDTLVSTSISSPLGKGIGVTAVDNTNGTWEFSTDNGATWANLKTAVEVSPIRPAYGNAWPDGTPNAGNPANSGVFMLAADGKNRIRFVPNVGFTGNVTNGVTYMAWNQVIGGNGAWTNLNPAGKVGIDMMRVAFSMDAVGNKTTDNLNIEVLPGNNAPVLDPVLVLPLAPIDKDPMTNPGTLLTALIPGTAVTDPDTGALEGLAVTNVDNSNGAWEYSTDGGANWSAFGTPSDTNARLLAADANTRVRFVPNAGYEGTPEITFRAWDQVLGTAGGTTDVSVNGGVTSFSTALGTAAIAVGNVLLPPPVLPEPPINPEIPIDPGFLPLLKNPPAPPTPDPIVIGNPPAPDVPESQFPLSIFPFALPLSLLPFPFVFPQLNPALEKLAAAGKVEEGEGEGDGCPCATIINQQQSNPVTSIIQGTAGDDRLVSKSKAKSLSNKEKDDEKSLKQQANTVYGLQGKDQIFGGAGDDNLFGGAGNDVVQGGKGRDFIKGGAGNDRLYGGKGSDVIFGGAGKDQLYGGKGNDFLSGGAGDDIIYGEQGNDVMAGGAGNDRLLGGDGNDTICGCGGDDILDGGKGDDILYGGTDNDILYGGHGKEVMYGGKGSDILFGDQGNDFLSGGAENDALYGGKGNDIIFGGAGHDLLVGGDGNDILWGGAGHDLLIGGKGLDILIGGEGSDRFQLSANSLDTIIDFKVGEDFFELAKGLKLTDLQFVQGVGSTVIGLQPGTLFPSDKPLAILVGVNTDSITPNSFLSA